VPKNVEKINDYLTMNWHHNDHLSSTCEECKKHSSVCDSVKISTDENIGWEYEYDWGLG